MFSINSYLIRKLLFLIPLIIGVSFIVFFAINFIPGNPIRIMLGIEATEEMEAELKEEYGLNQPFLVRYFKWFGSFIKGDFGKSIITGNSINKEILTRFQVTLQLTILSVILSLIIAIPIGVISAIKQNSVTDFIVRIGVLSGISLPSFALGILLILFMSKIFGWLPPFGFVNLWENFFVSIQILILPVVSLGVRLAASISRMTRSSMLEVLRKDYIRTAKAKGLKNSVITYKHALHNSLIPILTLVGLQIGYLFGGAVVIEQIFSLPGLGRYLLTGIYKRDYPVVMSVVLIIAISFAFVNTLVDILYAFVDPRIKYD
ncbi:MAG: ABC transporter permease [Halanaerobium sp.]